MLTLNGVGAYLGLAKVYNGGELNSPANAPASIAYPVALNTAGDTMTIDINYGTGFWHFVLVKDQATHLDEITEEPFKVYPNPVADLLTLELPEGKNEVVVYDLTGRILSRFNVFAERFSYDMRSFSSGLYIIELRNEQKIKAFKVFKE
jgi:hypothetical protein